MARTRRSPSAELSNKSGEVLAEVGQVGLLLQAGRLGGEPRRRPGQDVAPFAVLVQHAQGVQHIPAQQGQVVDDEGQRVVDLVGHPGGQAPQARELLGLDQRHLRLAQVLLQADDPLSGTQPDPELVPVERLGQEVVRAGLHPLDQVLLLGFRGEEHGVDIAGSLGRTDAPDQSRPVQLRHHPVGDDRWGSSPFEEVPRLGPVLGRRSPRIPTSAGNSAAAASRRRRHPRSGLHESAPLRREERGHQV